ncbi:MAG: response regulator [Prevotella sp.]|nr:response regulator [Prevotella sp.]
MYLSSWWFIIGIIALVVAFYLGRWLYIRSLRMRNRLQMERIYTNITHELLTPLTIISASVEHLRNSEPKYGYDYDMMQLNIQRMVRLLQQVLETSKSQAGELKLLVSNGDVMKFIRETALTIEPLMQKKGLKFSINCTPESMMGWIDTDKLDKIIFNLLTNAAKYTEKQGHVELDVKTNKRFDHIIIRVRDNGIGIPKERQKGLFHRFYDGEYRNRNTFGTGIGLSLTRDLVYLHHGTISFESEEGKGTTFTITLPINKETFAPSQIDEKNKINIKVPQSVILDFAEIERKTGEEIAKEHEAEENAYKLLIVEDNVELLILMQQLLRTQYRIYTAQNGMEALQVIQSTELDLIISDVMMPEMNGYELTKAIKGNPDYSHLPIILLTAKIQDNDRQEALTIGADDFIAKPFHLQDLRLRIDNIIKNRQRIQREFRQQSIKETKKKIAEAPTPDNEFLQRAIQCVNDHLDDTEFDRDAFAREMGASQSTLYNKLRAMTGMNVTNFIRSIRMKAIDDIIRQEPDIRVSDLAYKVGFKDPKYFATAFKKEFGIQPKEYIEKMTSATTS